MKIFNHSSDTVKNVFSRYYTTAISIEIASAFSKVIDGIFIARALGSIKMASYGIALPFFSLVTLFSGMISVGAGNLFSKSMTRGQTEEGNKIFNIAIRLYAISTLIMLLLSTMFVREIAYLLRLSPETSDVALYLKGLIVGIPAIFGLHIFSVFIDGIKDRKIIRYSIVLKAIVDVVGDAVNTFIIHGDMFGMAVATSISYYVALIIVIANIIISDNGLKIKEVKLDFTIIKEIFIVGLPKLVKRACKAFRPIIINTIVLTMGTYVAMSSLSVQNNLRDMFEIFGSALGSVVIMMIQIFYYERDVYEIKNTLKQAFKFAIFGIGGLAILVFVFARPIAHFYSSNDKAVMSMATVAIRMFAISLPLIAINEVIFNYLQGMKYFKYSLFVVVFQRFAGVCLTAFLFVRWIGITGVWVAFPTSEFLLIVINLIVMFIYSRKKKTLNSFLMLDKLDNESYIKKNFDFVNGDSISRLSEAINAFCKENGVDGKNSYLTALCIEELAKNFTEHGCVDTKDYVCNILVIIKNGKVTLRLRDNAAPFDLRKQIENISEDKTKNIGLRIVSKSAKDIVYTNSLNLNNLIIYM